MRVSPSLIVFMIQIMRDINLYKDYINSIIFLIIVPITIIIINYTMIYKKLFIFYRSL